MRPGESKCDMGDVEIKQSSIGSGRVSPFKAWKSTIRQDLFLSSCASELTSTGAFAQQMRIIQSHSHVSHLLNQTEKEGKKRKERPMRSID